MVDHSATATTSRTGSNRREKGRPIKRSRTGCLSCRARKVKCDEVAPICGDCARLKYDCVWQSPLEPNERGEPSHTPARSIVGDPYPHSCKVCRDVKARCSRHRPSCERCASRYIVCEYEDVTRRSTERPAPLSSASPNRPIPVPAPPTLVSSEDVLATRQTVDDLINAYYIHVHSKAGNSFLHRGRLDRDMREGKASPILIKSICAVAARFLPGADATHPEGGDVPAQAAREVKMDLIEGLDRFSAPKLCAALNIVHHEYSSGRIGSAWMFVGIATRMALAMGFNEEIASADTRWVEREMRRRIMWSAFCIDAFAAGGYREYGLSQNVVDNLDLPCSDYSYCMSIPSKGVRLADADTALCLPAEADGLTARFVRLMAIRREILYYTRHPHNFPTKPWMPGSEYSRLCSKLQHWWSTMPPQFAFTLDNLYGRKATHEIDALAILHIWYERMSTTLHRIAVPYRERQDVPRYTLGDLSDAPRDWLSSVRDESYQHVCNVAARFRTLDQWFSDLSPSHWQFCMFAYDATRDQLGTLAVLNRQLSADERSDITLGLEAMINVAGRSTRYYSYGRRIIRDIIRFCQKHGYLVQTMWNHELCHSHTHGTQTPAAGPVLQKMPYQRRYLHHPRLEDEPQLSSLPDPASDQPLAAQTWTSMDDLPEQLLAPLSPPTGHMASNPLEGLAALLDQHASTTGVDEGTLAGEPHPADMSAYFLPFEMPFFDMNQVDPFAMPESSAPTHTTGNIFGTDHTGPSINMNQFSIEDMLSGK